jgi:hypothetical protein
MISTKITKEILSIIYNYLYKKARYLAIEIRVVKARVIRVIMNNNIKKIIIVIELNKLIHRYKLRKYLMIN